MSKKKTNKVWNGMNVVEETDTTTGIITISSRHSGSGRSKKPGKLLASSAADGSWKINDEAEFRRVYNNAQRAQGKQTLDQKTFEKEFNTSGVPQFNQDRADVLNDRSNYSSDEEYERAVKSFKSAGTPDVKDPSTGTQNNSNGNTVTDPDKNNNDDEDKTGLYDWSQVKPVPEVDLDSSQALLRYPLDRVPDLDYDFVTFTAYQYTAGQLISSIDASNRLGARAESISLPIIPNIEETNGVEWGEDKLNQIQSMAASVAGATMDAPSIGEALTSLTAGTGEAINKILAQNPDLKDRLIAHFAGQAVGANILGRTTGAVLNPNLELLFKGPQLRTFNFNFKLRPRYEDEADQCRKIIRAFKRNMHVQRGTSGLFLTTPNIFKIQYYHKGGEHPFMNRLKPCALTNFKVSYTPDNNYMTYSDGSMTGYDINMSFNEIVPIYADEIKEVGGTGY